VGFSSGEWITQACAQISTGRRRLEVCSGDAAMVIGLIKIQEARVGVRLGNELTIVGSAARAAIPPGLNA
jgi:hypothetical protein